MIISRAGAILTSYDSRDGVIVHDGKYAICLDYNQSQKEIAREIARLKAYLSATDYQAIKFSDGAISEDDYAPIREQRKDARAEINRLEAIFSPPTISNEEIKYAERIAEETIKKEAFAPILI